MRVEEEAEARAELVDIEAAAARPLHVLDAVVNGEGQFLQRGGAGFADVVAADGDGVEARRELGAELEGVDHQAHGGRGRIDVFLLRDVFLEDVVLDGAGDLLPVGFLLFGDHQVHGPQHGGGRIDGHGGGDVLQVDAVEEDLHVLERVDGDAALADLALAHEVVGVVAHQGGQIEGDGQPGAAVGEQVLVALVGFLRRSEAGELAHGVQLAAIAGGVNAAGVRRLAGIAEIGVVFPVFGQVGLGVKAANGVAGDGGVAGVAMLVEIGAGGRANGLLGILFQGAGERGFSPLLFGVGGMAAFENIGHGRFGYLLVGAFFVSHDVVEANRSSYRDAPGGCNGHQCSGRAEPDCGAKEFPENCNSLQVERAGHRVRVELGGMISATCESAMWRSGCDVEICLQ